MKKMLALLMMLAMMFTFALAEDEAPAVVEETPTPAPVVVEETPAPVVVEETPAPVVEEATPAPVVEEAVEEEADEVVEEVEEEIEEVEEVKEVVEFEGEVKIVLVNEEIEIGDVITLKAVIDGNDAPYTIQWQINEGNGWTDIANATDDTYEFVLTEALTDAAWRVVIEG